MREDRVFIDQVSQTLDGNHFRFNERGLYYAPSKWMRNELKGMTKSEIKNKLKELKDKIGGIICQNI